ncbi:MAG: immune inhibitor A [Planctomycetota bacterium]|nr:immune inhibitor A [Planctomycetota bacterium]
MRFTTLTLALMAMTPVMAQELAPETLPTQETPALSSLDVIAATDAWRATYGPEWQARLDKQTGHVRFLFGGHTEPLFQPTGDGDFEVLARHYISEAFDQLGIDAGRLELDKVDFLPLGLVGTTDKTSVQFQQLVDGVAVERGFVNALFDQGGRLLSLDTVGLPDSLLPTRAEPTIDIERAERLARKTFSLETGLDPVGVGGQGLGFAQEGAPAARRGVGAWKIRVGNEVEGEPKAFLYSVSAAGDLRVVRADDQIHYFDVGGSVQALATGGQTAPSPANPPVPFPMGYMRVTSPQAGTTFTDANGVFNFPGVTGPIQATFEFVGTYNNVNNQAGGDYSLTTTLADGSGNSVMMNPGSIEEITAQANCMLYINLMRDWTRSVNPADSSSDFVATANPNITSTCNAYYNGVSTNYYLAGGGCNNTAFSNVIWHEMGHWMNDVYGSGNGSDGFGEGNADVFAMYQADDPIVGMDFCGTGCFIRSGENTKQFCGDNNPGCFGEVHADGEVLMGALWKVRKRMNTTYGDFGGDLLSNVLFNSWMNAYNDGQIRTIIEDHWLTLDDDDGNIGNGTPNYPDIDGGFRDQGFPGYDLLFINITNVTSPSDGFDENGPYGVSAKIDTNFATTITSANLTYFVDGGFPSVVPMTQASGDRWYATIPGQASPSKVEWFVSAFDDGGNSLSFPKDAPASLNGFTVGDVQVFYFDDLDTSGDNGWTHAQVAEQDDWQHDAPNGTSGDPSSTYSGSKIWGNDLGPSGWNGAYKPNVENYLRSPFIDLSGATGAKLVYQRWLTVEEAIFDQAQINVNGTNVWQNPSSGNLIDTAWTQHEVDISAFDGQNVQLEWRLITDGGLEFGGWNLDDVSVQTLKPSPTVGLPSNFGSGTAGASGVPSIDSLGQPATLGNLDFAVAIKDAAPEATAFLALGFAQTSIPTLGVTALVLPSTILNGSTDLFGQFDANFVVPSDPAFVGFTAYFQGLVVDAGGPAGFSATDGLSVTIVP